MPAWAVSVAGLGWCLKKMSDRLGQRTVPMMGIASAFIFAAQMVNFPVLGGTSGHLLGGVLAAVLLGPFAGAMVLTCVLFVQCLVFQDGGLIALGANVVNMAFVGSMGGYLIYRLIAAKGGRSSRTVLMIGVAVASWLSVVLAAVACSLELALSGTSPLRVVLPAMVGVHAVIGLGEAVITSLVIGFLIKVRPDVIYRPGRDDR